MFNWNDGPFELVLNGKVYSNIKYSHSNNNKLTTITDANGNTLSTVYTNTADGYGSGSRFFQELVYVRKREVTAEEMAASIEAYSDEDIVKAMRTTQELVCRLHAEISKRGYVVYDEDGDEWLENVILTHEDFTKYGKFVKTITTEKVL